MFHTHFLGGTKLCDCSVKHVEVVKEVNRCMLSSANLQHKINSNTLAMDSKPFVGILAFRQLDS